MLSENSVTVFYCLMLESQAADHYLYKAHHTFIFSCLRISVCFILIAGVIILYKKHKKSRSKSDKTDVQISLPTLGTQYELASLLSLNTVGRKSSNQSEGSNPANDDLEKCEKSQVVFEGRVNQFIDASTMQMNKAENE